MSNYSSHTPGISTAMAASAAVVAKDAYGRQQATVPQPLVRDYVGRVSTFYNAAQATYSEMYEPVRKTAVGDVWRVESRLIAGRWVHLAYNIKGVQITLPSDGCGMFEQQDLPLLFDPTAEKDFALATLAASRGKGTVRLGGNVLVYESKKDSAVGIVRSLQDVL